MTNNKLPEGVGKKIVEALKKQSEIEVKPIEEDVVEQEASFSELMTEENNDDELVSAVEDEQLYVQEEPVFNNHVTGYAQQQYNQPIYNEPIQQQNYEQDIPYVVTQQSYVHQPVNSYNDFMDSSYAEQVNQYPRAKEFAIPANVAVLKRLISQLPQGVSKQTGAQIIRQTMEALGISMSTVLTEAQNFQDGLNNSVRECVSTIQEFKNNIKNLEKQVSDYQKQSAQVNDLISLFIMTDK